MKATTADQGEGQVEQDKQDKQGTPHRAERHIQEHHDEQQRHRHHDGKLAHRPLLVLELATILDVVTRRQAVVFLEPI